MPDDLFCPISNVLIGRNVVRATALLSAILLVDYVATRSPWILNPRGFDALLQAYPGVREIIARAAQGRLARDEVAGSV